MKLGLNFFLFFVLAVNYSYSQCSFVSSNGTGYTITVAVSPVKIIETDKPNPCAGGKYYVVEVDYSVAIQGNIPGGNFHHLRGEFDLDGDKLRFVLPTSAGVGKTYAELVSVCNSRTFIPNSAPTLTISINAAGISNQSGVPCQIFSSPLPVELLSFDVESKAYGIEVNWQTATERNNDFFIVERSLDGYTFEFIEKVFGAGNSHQVLNYSVIDTNPYHGLAYYRLTQVDYDGSSRTEGVRSVVHEVSSMPISLYPNPVNNETIFVNGNYSNMSLAIFGSEGRSVRSDFDGLSNAIDVSHFSNGLYFFHFKNELTGYTEIIRVIVAK